MKRFLNEFRLSVLLLTAMVLASTLVVQVAGQGGLRRSSGVIYDTSQSDTAFRGEHTVSFAQGGTAADALDTQFFIADRAYTVTGIKASWGVAESTGAMDIQVDRLQATEACGSGDNLLNAVIDATGTANTVATGTLTTTTANLDLASGNRLCVDLTATPNEVTNMVVTVTMQPD